MQSPTVEDIQSNIFVSEWKRPNDAKYSNLEGVEGGIQLNA
jgi:hypothetical protein